MVNYFFMLAEEVRGIMAKLGVRRFQDLIGRTDFLKRRSDGGPNRNPKADMLRLDAILHNARNMRPEASIEAGTVAQNFQLEKR